MTTTGSQNIRAGKPLFFIRKLIDGTPYVLEVSQDDWTYAEPGSVWIRSRNEEFSMGGAFSSYDSARAAIAKAQGGAA